MPHHYEGAVAFILLSIRQKFVNGGNLPGANCRFICRFVHRGLLSDHIGLFSRLGREGRVLTCHVPGDVLERAVAARADTVADAVLDLRHLAAGGGGSALSCFPHLALTSDLVVAFRDPLGEAVTLATKLRLLALARWIVLGVTIGTEERNARAPFGRVVQFGRKEHGSFAPAARADVDDIDP
jgi:hypothetical protein